MAKTQQLCPSASQCTRHWRACITVRLSKKSPANHALCVTVEVLCPLLHTSSSTTTQQIRKILRILERAITDLHCSRHILRDMPGILLKSLPLKSPSKLKWK